MKTLSKLVKNDLVIGLPKLNFDEDKIYDTCQFGKQVRNLLNQRTWFPILGLLNCCLLTYLDLWMF